MTDEQKIRELWELIEAALRIRDLRPRPSFLDSCLKITVICAVWTGIALSGSITAYLVTELVPGFSDWLRTF